MFNRNKELDAFFMGHLLDAYWIKFGKIQKEELKLKISYLSLAANRAENPDFKALWMDKEIALRNKLFAITGDFHA